jgi:protein SCO1/2
VTSRALRVVAAWALAGLGAASVAHVEAQDRTDPTPKALLRVGVTEHLDGKLPLDLAFVDESGREVRLRDSFKPGKPVILTLNYYRCPMLCTLELNGLVAALKGMAWSAGDEFEVVTVSIDPREQPKLAREKKDAYLADYARTGSESGWRFLTGSADSIAALTRAAGFDYEYDAATDQYGHAAVILLATPEGRVSRYLYGVAFDPATLKLGLLEASHGRIGNSLDRFILYCYHYDSLQGRYALAAMRLMRVGAGLTALILGAFVSGFWLRERKRLHGSA